MDIIEYLTVGPKNTSSEDKTSQLRGFNLKYLL